jgi:hypothetical protein
MGARRFFDPVRTALSLGLLIDNGETGDNHNQWG